MNTQPSAEAQEGLGLLLASQGRGEEAFEHLQQALALSGKPQLALALAELCRQHQKWSQAQHFLNVLLQKNPRDIGALNCQAQLYAERGQLDLARQIWSQALQNAPQDIRIRYNLAQLEIRAEAWAAAEHHLKQVLVLEETYAPAWSALGRCYLQQNRPQDAIDALQKSLDLEVNADSYSDLAMAHWELSDWDCVENALQKALVLDPKHLIARFNQSQLLLLKGHWQAGFKAYEAARWSLNTPVRPLGNLPQQLWNGDPCNTLLLCCEQGFGDSLQFIRYLQAALGRCPNIWLECPVELAPLFQHLPVQIIKEGEPLPTADAWCPLLRLAFLFPEIPTQSPYLPFVQSSLQLEEDPLNIGIVWATGRQILPPWDRLYKRKSLDPSHFVQLAAQHPECCFYSLQVGADAQTLPGILDTEPLTDFGISAKWVQHLDLIITVDTAVAHLAGGLNRPVWLLLANIPDWRWQTEGENSIWYPSMQIFRQTQPENWDSVFQTISKTIATVYGR